MDIWGKWVFSGDAKVYAEVDKRKLNKQHKRCIKNFSSFSLSLLCSIFRVFPTAISTAHNNSQFYSTASYITQQLNEDDPGEESGDENEKKK